MGGVRLGIAAREEGSMTDTCKFCGQHPYEYIDVCRGAAKPEIVCCEAAQSEAMEAREAK